MKNLSKNKNLLYNSLLVFLLLIGIGITFFTENHKTLNFTGFIVNSEGSECDGNWTLNETSLCINGTQNLTWISSDTTNCTSPIIQTQSCECVENWSCSSWSSCLNETQNRTCNDLNSCGTTTLKPNETQSCECVENWSCSSWSSCLDGQQDRTCNDLNSCGTTTNKPDEEQSCSEDNTSLEDTTNEQSSDVSSNSLEEDNNSTEEVLTEETINQDDSLSSDNQNDQRKRTSSCTPNWKCGDWQDCINNSQIRICIDKNKCNSNENKPETKKECYINETCYDKIKNQNETGIDCGGDCKPCTIFNLIGNTISETIGSGKEFILKSLSKNNFILSIVLIIFIMIGEAVILLRIKRKKELILDNNLKINDANNENRNEIKEEKEEEDNKADKKDKSNKKDIPKGTKKKENANNRLNKRKKVNSKKRK
ncbi:hypothetical protein GYA25_02785 [Candidatus Woesearchaeota archaeon]|nr:hypothetical protein [Candidatus Woesearchaeota archaeon]